MVFCFMVWRRLGAATGTKASTLVLACVDHIRAPAYHIQADAAMQYSLVDAPRLRGVALALPAAYP